MPGVLMKKADGAISTPRRFGSAADGHLPISSRALHRLTRRPRGPAPRRSETALWSRRRGAMPAREVMSLAAPLDRFAAQRGSVSSRWAFRPEWRSSASPFRDLRCAGGSGRHALPQRVWDRGVAGTTRLDAPRAPSGLSVRMATRSGPLNPSGGLSPRPLGSPGRWDDGPCPLDDEATSRGGSRGGFRSEDRCGGVSPSARALVQAREPGQRSCRVFT